MALIVGFHCDVIVQLRASAKKACGVARPRPAPCSGEVRGRSDLDPTSTAVFLVIFEHPDSLFFGEESTPSRCYSNAENWQDLVMGDGERYGEFEGHVITRKN